jgi:epoxide hydrolase-like predicted phosphatase
MIDAVIFDFGGVLVRAPDRKNRLTWERELGLKDWESEEIVFNSPMGIMAQSGKITDEELWTWVGQRLDLHHSQLDEFRRDFRADDVLDDELARFVRGIQRSHQTALLSNATRRLRQVLEEVYQLTDAFDVIVVSAEEGLMKPDPEIYIRTLRRLGCQPQASIFIDDTKENVDAAIKLGMNGIHFMPKLDINNSLQRMGLEFE